MQEQTKSTPQRFTWTIQHEYDTFEEANLVRNQLKEKGLRVKVNRRGLGGKKYVVKTGEPIQKERAKKEKKEEKEVKAKKSVRLDSKDKKRIRATQRQEKRSREKEVQKEGPS